MPQCTPTQHNNKKKEKLSFNILSYPCNTGSKFTLTTIPAWIQAQFHVRSIHMWVPLTIRWQHFQSAMPHSKSSTPSEVSATQGTGSPSYAQEKLQLNSHVCPQLIKYLVRVWDSVPTTSVTFWQNFWCYYGHFLWPKEEASKILSTPFFTWST
jgi:hypothetical protein